MEDVVAGPLDIAGPVETPLARAAGLHSEVGEQEGFLLIFAPVAVSFRRGSHSRRHHAYRLTGNRGRRDDPLVNLVVGQGRRRTLPSGSGTEGSQIGPAAMKCSSQMESTSRRIDEGE